MRAATVLGVLLLASFAAVAADQPALVSLNGVRQVEVTIGGDRDVFEVAVRMKPVQCFDKATNERLNIQKARSYGLQGLLKHLSGGAEKVRASVSGVAVTSNRLDGKFYRLTFQVPRGGIEIVRDSKPREQSRPTQKTALTEEVQLTSALLECFGDHSATIEELAATFDAELAPVKSKALESGNEFEIAIAELEEHLITRLAQFEKDVRAEKLLLVAEQSELLERATTARERGLQELRVAVEQREQAQAKNDRAAQFSDIVIEADFKRLSEKWC